MNSSLRSLGIAFLGIAVLLVPALPAATADAPTAVAAPAKVKRTEPTTCLATAITPGATGRARYVWQRVRKAGFAPAAAAGVVAYLDQASTIAPQALNRVAKRAGIAQWPQPRWAAYVAHTEAKGLNRWSFRRQINWLLDEMTATTGTFNIEKFKVRTDAVKAALVLNRKFLPISSDLQATRGALTAKAAGWFRVLAPMVVAPKSAAYTYGSRTSCAPPNVSLERCPMVPNSFKEYFANSTGFTWDDMSPSAQLMSRCAYIRFPHIRMHGTYNGHMPVWSQAIDFMMPSGCVNSSSGSYTRSAADRKVGNRLARYMFSNHERFNIDYLIWQDSLRNPIEHSDENVWAPIADWRDDGYNNGDCTNTHFDHVHVSTYADSLAASTQKTPGLNPDGKPW